MFYKVVELNQRSFLKRRMKAADLQEKLNEEAAHGWVLQQVLDSKTFGFVTGSKDVVLMIFAQPD